MKLTIAQKWVEALRSGKYKQGKMALRTKTKHGTVKHCCLGVLCELYNKTHKNKLKIKKTTKPDDVGQIKNSVFKIGSEVMSLPNKVKNWAGIDENTGLLVRGEGYTVKNQKLFNLSEINDEGVSFNKIAKFIEERYEDL